MVALHAGVMYCTEITDALWKRYLSQHPENLIDDDSSLIHFARFVFKEVYSLTFCLEHNRFDEQETSEAMAADRLVHCNQIITVRINDCPDFFHTDNPVAFALIEANQGAVLCLKRLLKLLEHRHPKKGR